MDVEIVSKFLTTLPEDDDHPYRTGPWRPQTIEWDADGLTPVEGEVPHDLDGIYLRNTENPLHPALKAYHPFDGDGMLLAFRIDSDGVRYRNRYVRTRHFQGRSGVTHMGTAAPGDWRANIGRRCRSQSLRVDSERLINVSVRDSQRRNDSAGSFAGGSPESYPASRTK